MAQNGTVGTEWHRMVQLAQTSIHVLKIGCMLGMWINVFISTPKPTKRRSDLLPLTVGILKGEEHNDNQNTKTLQARRLYDADH